MGRDTGGDAKLAAILDRLLDPVEELLASLAAGQAADESAPSSGDGARTVASRGENISATIAIPKPLAKRGGQTPVRFSALVACADCGGTGASTAATGTCAVCAGGGRVEVERRLNVTFPAGVTAGAELRVSGEGNESRNGGPPGDLLLYVMLVGKGRLTRVRAPRR